MADKRDDDTRPEDDAGESTTVTATATATTDAGDNGGDDG
jgi:hypothetical protein